ncbi:iron-containing alcohol dehydrogenase [Desulfovermiculus halophilus]|uniref:iron-containing alcohol dehydrogenase n=1 Tax=Desulfovermiculus halophilus TaxID=339722 RepID=UPI0004899710|nr:iron-containing alcohol dehydrogenase [Desulfovermiculus halophilus]
MSSSYFEFYSPVKIISGHKALDNIGYELECLQASRPLIVTDACVKQAGLLRQVQKAFKSSQAEIGTIFDQVPPDSSTRVVNQAAHLYQEGACDSIVAVGGGSVIDTAKGVNIVVSEGCTDLMLFAGAERLTRPLKPLVAVPTTAGTGSEATLAAVIYNEEKHLKMAFTSYYLMPRTAILDPRMTETMPARVTAATGMDALAHAVEAATCLQKNPLSDAYAFAAVRLIRDNLIRAVKDSTNQTVRLNMANAAAMAGIAFSNSMVGIVHALGHAAGGACHLPHGTAMSIFLPFGLEYILPKCADSLAQLLLPLGSEETFVQTRPEDRAEQSIERIKELKEELYRLCGLPRTLSEAGVPRDRLGAIAKAAVDDPALIYSPMEMEAQDALEILKKAY